MEEMHLLEQIKFLLLCKNDYQALRLIEKYGYNKKIEGFKKNKVDEIEYQEEIDKKCIDFAEWIVNDYYTNPDWEYKTINELLNLYNKRKKVKQPNKQKTITIIDFINVNENNLSNRTKLILRNSTKFYEYMNELSVVNLINSRICGIKSIKEIIHFYPNLENEIGSLSINSVKDYFIKKK